MVELLSLYHPIPPNDRKLFRSLIKSQTYAKGDFLLFDGDVQSELYLVKSGVAYLYAEKEGKQKILDFAYHNRFCVDLKSFSSQEASAYCIQCIEDCEVESISYEHLEQVFDASAAVERAYRLLLERILGALLDKAMQMELLSMGERFKWIMQKRSELFGLVPHKYIASYINVDATNFSKLYNQHCINNGLYYE